MEFLDDDAEVKQVEDAFRKAYVDRKDTPFAFTETPFLFGMQHSASPYAPTNYVYSGRHAKFQHGDVVTEPDMAAVRAKLPEPFKSDICLLEGAVIAGGGALRIACCNQPAKGDNDIFIIGGDHLQKVDRMTRAIASLYTLEGMPCYALSRTANGITVTCHALADSGLPAAVFQFIMRRYDNVAQLLSGFDLDAAAVAFGVRDGKPYLSALPRALRAIRWQANLVDADRQSETFEQRIHKYAVNKGFDAIVPGLDVPSFPFGRLANSCDKKHGLCALLRMALSSPGSVRDDPTYAGAVNGVDLNGDCKSFIFRFERRCGSVRSFPLVYAIPESPWCRHRNPFRPQAQTEAEATPALFPLLQTLIDATMTRPSPRRGECCLPKPVAVPFEILEGRCGSFRPLSNAWID